MWQPVFKVETRVTVMGREPWELGVLAVVLIVTNLTSREWVGPLGSVGVTVVALILTSLVLKRLKQAIPSSAMTAYWKWITAKDVYVVGREEICKPLVLEREVRSPNEPMLE